MEKLLHLFNTLWFERGVLSETPGSDPDPRPAGLRISHIRSSSDQVVLSLNTNLLSDAESPKSVLHPTPKLETIVSGIEIGEEKVVKKMKVGGGGRRRRRRSRSLTEMEVKGFMDLGFVFSEEDRQDSSLVSMIPGLQSLGHGKSEEDGVCVKCGVLRGRRFERKEKIPLRVGSVVDEMEMKNQIKFWAHSVASAVR